MTIDTAFAALVEANPIPDADAYAEYSIAAAAFLTATRERTMDMKTIETQEPTKERTRRKRQPLIAVAAFLLVIALGVAAAMVMSESGDVANVPAPPFDTPQDAAHAYYTALNAGDADVYFSIMAEGASSGEVNGNAIAPEDKVRARVEWYGAIGSVATVLDCTVETEFQAKCTVLNNDPIADKVSGVSQYEGTAVIRIDEQGLIARISSLTVPPGIDVDTVRADAWSEWFAANHPDLTNELDQLWGSDPMERTGTEIGRDLLAAAEAFDAQYEG